MIIEETTALIEKLYGESLKEISVERIIVGVFFTGVKLSNRCGGISYTPVADLHNTGSCCFIHNKKGQGAFKGASVYSILKSSPVSPLTTTVKIVVLNALSSFFLSTKKYNIVYDTDILDLVTIKSREKIGMVGAFEPFIRRLKDMAGIDLNVIEKKKGSLRNDEMKFFVPAKLAKEILPKCTTAIITGASIANGTIEKLLGYVGPKARSIVTGPTASFLPDAFFRRNVDVVGGVVVTDADCALDMLSEGAGAHQLFDVCLRKINIMKKRSTRAAR